jgi:hypothetical protein
MPTRDETPSSAELDQLAEITPADIARAKRLAAQRVPQATRALNAERDDTAGDVTGPIPDSQQ